MDRIIFHMNTKNVKKKYYDTLVIAVHNLKSDPVEYDITLDNL